MSIEETVYNGVVYYRKPDHTDDRNHYFRARRTRHHKLIEHYLHRQVYIDNFGPIPKDMQIHHIDHNPANNNVNNLELISRSDHFKEHEEKRLIWCNSQKNKDNLKRGLVHGIAFMKSEAGRELSRKKCISMRDNSMINCVCVQCGSNYVGCAIIKTPMYCSKICKEKAARSRKKTIVCAYCSKNHLTSFYSSTRYCGKSCSNRGRSKQIDNT